MPITQDASPSAYQIMIFFLNNEDLARRTNSFKGAERDENPYNISDLYSSR